MNSRRGLALSLALALSWPTLARAEPSSSEADTELQRGLAAYADGEYEQAIAHFKRSHALRADPSTLYAWAQATRSVGDCAAAIDLYQRFIDSGAAGESREAAVQNQQRCREQLAAEPREPAPQPVPPPAVTSPPADTPPPQRVPRARVGPALLGSGAALVVVGIALVIVGEQLRRRQRATHDYDRFDRLDGPIDGFYVGGGVTLGVGAVVATVGGVRLARRRRARR
ncbi:MAG: hypothetical protein IPN32_02105 [Deltaproteobacteria bacterium]|nr:hypothetical protein [Deltaproteobacteria bacterium]